MFYSKALVFILKEEWSAFYFFCNLIVILPEKSKHELSFPGEALVPFSLATYSALQEHLLSSSRL